MTYPPTDAEVAMAADNMLRRRDNLEFDAEARAELGRDFWAARVHKFRVDQMHPGFCERCGYTDRLHVGPAAPVELAVSA